MSNKKCHKCNTVDSIHIKDEGKSKLISAFGPKDDDGLQLYLIYCHNCNYVNFYKPGWFGIKFDSLLDAKEVYKSYLNGEISHREMGMFAGKLQKAMIDDGVLPPDWQIS